MLKKFLRVILNVYIFLLSEDCRTWSSKEDPGAGAPVGGVVGHRDKQAL